VVNFFDQESAPPDKILAMPVVHPHTLPFTPSAGMPLFVTLS